MSEKVVSLRGEGISQSEDNPADNVVDRCRRLLALAESGQLRGIAIAAVERGYRARFFWSYDDGPVTWHVLSTAIAGLAYGWNRIVSGEDCEMPPPSEPVA